jgi:hypothetical protein
VDDARRPEAESDSDDDSELAATGDACNDRGGSGALFDAESVQQAKRNQGRNGQYGREWDQTRGKHRKVEDPGQGADPGCQVVVDEDEEASEQSHKRM